MRNSLFEGQDVCLTRGGESLLSSFSFSLEAGQCWGIHGENGVGKSSLLRMLAGLLPAMAGRFAWNSKPQNLMTCEHRSRVSYVNALSSSVQTWSRMTPLSCDTRDRWGLTSCAQVPFSYLSQGQKQRMYLASCLKKDRPLWLLDEPAHHLDTHGKDMLKDLLTSHIHQGNIICLVSHEDFLITPHKIAFLETIKSSS